MQSTGEQLYKGKYEIVLYECDDEECLVTIVSNIRELLKYFDIPITQIEEQRMIMRVQYAFNKSNLTSREIICVKGERFRIHLLVQYKKRKVVHKNRK